MDTKKLEKWAELLLDTGKRNNLINFRDTRTSTVEVLLPSSEALFNHIDGTHSFEVYDPKLAEIDEPEKIHKDEQQQLDIPESPDDKSEYISRYAQKIKKQNQVLLYNAAANPLVVLKNINKKTRAFLEETGVNVTYMVFGFIHWKESQSSNYIYHAPILLIPIQLVQASAVEPYIIKPSEDDFIINPTFAYKIDAEYGIKLPDYADEGLLEYLNKIQNIVSKLEWTVTSECKIGLFSFLKINMYRDLKDNTAAILSNQNVRKLLGEAITEKEDTRSASASIPVTDPLIELHSVVDADSSQIEAIEMAKSGKSFILQGPPGTGKSQTITNIIAECLSDGKKVLFVSEKLAALNVVYNKLKQVGLSEFCLELHSHKANKKDIIADICHSLRNKKSVVSSKAYSEITLKKGAQNRLDAYAFALHQPQPIIGKSAYQLYEAFAALRATPKVEWPIPDINTHDESYLVEITSLLDQYIEFIPTIGYDYRKNTWYGYIYQDTSYQTKTEIKNNLSLAVTMLQELIPISHEISEKYGIYCNSLKAIIFWKSFFTFITESPIITPAMLQLANINAINTVFADLKSQSEAIIKYRSDLDAVFDDDIYNIDGNIYYKKLTKQFSGTFSRLFNSEYKQLLTDLRICKSDGKKLSYDEAVNMAEKLALYQEHTTTFKNTEASIIGFMGSTYAGINTDWDNLSEKLTIIQNVLEDDEITLGNLAEHSSFEDVRDTFTTYVKKIDQILAPCDDSVIEQLKGYYDSTIFNIHTAHLDQVLSKLSDCLAHMDIIENWCHFKTLLSRLNDQKIIPFIEKTIALNIEPYAIAAAFKKQFYYQWIDITISQTPILSTFNRISQDKAIHTFVEKDKNQFEINKAKIRAYLSSKRPSIDMITSGSPLAILLREGEKKRKQKSIRLLLSQTGSLVQRIKPCFLMSPLSVSTFLIADAMHFDVVVFDEASQIFPQDAIGAIYRADQLIVVGDSKQMPPSNFFHTTANVEDTDEEIGDVTDFESILDLCSASMQQLRLKWHYRSRYEQLINFSNKNFYDNTLITFPSSKADKPGIGVDYHYVNGIFDRTSRTNRKEAECVVDLIYQNIAKYPKRSLGVVAFNTSQQDLIDKLLSKRRQNTPDKEFFFMDNKKDPFFVKNLETVQGDERDTIIFSIAYGHDIQHRLLHNFGPLNRMGGERRLNVAVTRAKHNVQLVSSMRYTDIDLQRTSAEGARLLREYLDFAENGTIALERSLHLSAFEQFDSDFELEVCEFLRAHDFSVDTQVGCSGFKIDLGLKIPNSSDYVLAIECDGATYHSSKNARDRDRLRQEILEQMGWKFYRIWSTDWFRNQAVEKQRLLDVAHKALQTVTIAATPQEVETHIEAFAAPQEVETTTKTFIAPQEVKTSVESFEKTTPIPSNSFPPYKAADITKLASQYLPKKNLKGFIKAILDVEAPLSEELLLRRIVRYFGNIKVTSAVQKSYEYYMRGYKKEGIIRRNGFLYLADMDTITFRCPGDVKRSIKQIAPEELAAGMIEILKQNITADKSGLYRMLAQQCGSNRLSKTINAYLDSVLQLLSKDVDIEGEQITFIKK